MDIYLEMLLSVHPKRRGGGRSRARWYAQRAGLTRYSWRGRNKGRGRWERQRKGEEEQQDKNYVINNNNFITINK